jgi:hypothetical protein
MPIHSCFFALACFSFRVFSDIPEWYDGALLFVDFFAGTLGSALSNWTFDDPMIWGICDFVDGICKG